MRGQILVRLLLRGLSAKAQILFPVCYKGLHVGEYVADLVRTDRSLAVAAQLEFLSHDR